MTDPININTLIESSNIDSNESIDWSNPSSMVSIYFSVKEALWLPSYNRMANEKDGLNDQIKANLMELFSIIDQIREVFNSPINVHVAWRPIEYNKLIGGAVNSAHLVGLAVDFDIKGFDCKTARELIIKYDLLDKLDLRMEKPSNPDASWIHLDKFSPKPNRYFNP